MAFPYDVKVLEQCYVSPPPNSVAPTCLQLTFFDIPWLLCRPMKRIFFYEFPFSTSHFIHNVLPDLRKSLSLALQHFFPFVGTLVCPAQPTKPHILYQNGDSVRLTIVEADCDFNHLLTDFPKDVRELHPLVPETYFGNCLAICFVSAERGDLVGKNGVSITAKAIGSRIMELSTGALKGAEEWILKWQELSSGHLVVVAGSPKLSVYETDFGWGKPKKSEVIYIDVSGAISLAESRDEEGGVEVGVARSRAEMGAFSTLFKEGLENLF